MGEMSLSKAAIANLFLFRWGLLLTAQGPIPARNV